MNRRERMRRCYTYEELDRPAVNSRMNIPANDPTYDRLRKYLARHTEMRRHWPAQAIESEYPTQTYTEPFSKDFERHVTVLSTPKGALQSSFLVSLKGQPGLQEKYLLKSQEDIEKYLSLPLPEVGGDVSAFFIAAEKMGDTGIVDISLGFNPAGFVVELLGTEMFAMMSLTDREWLHALCRRQLEITLNCLKFLISQNVGPYFSMLGEEYIVPPIHGPADFADFNVRYDQPIIDLVHEAGGRIQIHSHGSMKEVIHLFVEMGTDVLHPLESAPQGDITAAAAKAAARGRMCLEGNIQIHRMYEATPEAIREETANLIRAAFDDHRGLIVSPTASPYIRGKGEVCFPQYQAMIETVLHWK